MTSKWKKILLVLTGIIALFVSFLIVVLFIDVNAYKPRIEQAASEAIGMDVRIEGKIRIVLFPAFGVSLEKVFIKNRGMDFVSANKVRIGPELIPLIRHEVRISEFELIRPVIIIEKDDSGMFNFGKSVQKIPKGEEIPAAFPETGRLTISKGELAYIDKKSGDKIEVKDFDLKIRNLSVEKTGGSDLLRNLFFEGNFKCGELMTKYFKISNLRVPIKAKNRIIDMNPITMNSFGENEKGSIKIDLTGEIPLYTAHYSAPKFHLEKFSSAFSEKKSMKGETGLSLSLVTKGKDFDEIKRKLNN